MITERSRIVVSVGTTVEFRNMVATVAWVEAQHRFALNFQVNPQEDAEWALVARSGLEVYRYSTDLFTLPGDWKPRNQPVRFAESDDVHLGIYRHSAGRLYLVTGLGHDANEEGRKVVITVPLETDSGLVGPAHLVHTLRQFTAFIEGGSSRRQFTYLGPELTEDMFPEEPLRTARDWPYASQPADEPTLPMGVYQHFKGPLYLVTGIGRDVSEPGRTVVIYIPLQINHAHLGPRIAIRTLGDFTARPSQDSPQRRFTYLAAGIPAQINPTNPGAAE